MYNDRPNPDVLLARVREEASRAGRGKLKIFFGYAAGVGKTYQMLTAAQRERAAGTEVVVGYVEPHGRPDTEALLAALETLPLLSVTYRGATLREFDLDAALVRRPALLLVDELAHSNAPGMRHPKRWQDVEELLAAGVNVWTTLNVQHIESLNDVISQITGIAVKETLPDTVLERADEIELIDITPDKLMERLAAGKVYVPAQAERALKNFFQKANLVALRELSLRQTASRVQQDVEIARQERAAVAPWVTSERVLVCVGPSPTNARIVRTTKRLARSLGAEWLAVAVDTGAEGIGAAEIKERTAHNLRMAEQLGAETQTLVGRNVADVLLDFAVPQCDEDRRRQDKTAALEELVCRYRRPTTVESKRRYRHLRGLRRRRSSPSSARRWRCRSYSLGRILESGRGGSGVRRHGMDRSFTRSGGRQRCDDLSGRRSDCVGAAGRGPSIASAIASVLVFDFFFVEPRLTFAVGDTEYLITFTVMLGIGLLISELTTRLQAQLRASQQQEHRTSQLFRMTRQLSELSGSDFLIRTAGRQLEEIFDAEVVFYLREEAGQLLLRYGERTSIVEQPTNEVVAQWVASNGKLAGAGTDTLPNASAIFVPLVGSQQVAGVLGVRPKSEGRLLDPEQIRLLETCGSLIALSIERDDSVLQAHQAQLQVQAEQLRNSLLDSVSHDLRTPLATISGTATSLLEHSSLSDSESLHTLVDESRRLARLVENLLDMARLDSGVVALNRQWNVLEEIVGVALHAVKREVRDFIVRVDIPVDFPLLNIDGFLIEQVLVNLLENASRYTPSGSEIEISALAKAKRAEIRIADNGPGVPSGSEEKIFDKFFRGSSITPDGRRGVGLGLAICRAIVEAHGGTITAHNRAQVGAEFVISLPCTETPPLIEAEATTDSAIA